MPKQEISQADIAETFCKMLFNSHRVKKGMLPDENQWGIDVLYHKRESGKIMFHWITPDMLEINLEFDLMELNKQGKQYIDSRIELIISQTESAREERQRNNQVIIHNSKALPETKPIVSAIGSAIKGNGTVH